MSTKQDVNHLAAPQMPRLAIPLTAHHIRFGVRADTEIVFQDFKGSALRGALVSVLRRTFCPEGGANSAASLDPLHQALCPICRLLSWEGDEEGGGDLRRSYAIEPPLGAQNRFAPGEAFDFGVALYGDSLAFFPYVALATGNMGKFGVGKKSVRAVAPGNFHLYERGKFTVEQIEAVNPLSNERLTMMAPGEHTVRAATLPVTHEQVMAAVPYLLETLEAHDYQLSMELLTPLRLTQGDHIVKTPAFFPFFKQIVLRVLDLCAQYGGGRPTLADQPLELKRDLYPYADQVQLVDDQSRWWDVKGYSGRLDRQQMLGGLVGHARYRAADWRPLLPWLLWGMSTHVGKNIVKGCGIYRLRIGQ
jgi:hypothetical protein